MGAPVDLQARPLHIRVFTVTIDVADYIQCEFGPPVNLFGDFFLESIRVIHLTAFLVLFVNAFQLCTHRAFFDLLELLSILFVQLWVVDDLTVTGWWKALVTRCWAASTLASDLLSASYSYELLD